MSEGHVHLHKTGHSWIDISVALCALVVSCASLAVAIHHGHAMEKLVTASSLPYLQLARSNGDPQGQPLLRLHAINAGTGPARVAKLVVAYDGAPVTGADELLRRCCSVEGAPRPRRTTSGMNGRLLAARTEVDFLTVRRAENDARTYQAVEAALQKIDVRACYCSVFDECWTVEKEWAEPVRVKDCTALAGEPFAD